MMREHDPRLDEIDCQAALRDLSLLVDLECDDACRSRLEHHLAGCPDCREMFLSERRLKAKLSRSCCEKAPRVFVNDSWWRSADDRHHDRRGRDHGGPPPHHGGASRRTLSTPTDTTAGADT